MLDDQVFLLPQRTFHTENTR